MSTTAARPPASLKTIAQAAAEAIKDGKVFEFELYMLHEVWDGAVQGLDFLKAVVMGEFADHRSTAVLITEALASFIPGVAIVQSVRDATAISLRLIYHPEKRSDWMEWVLLAVNLVVICLPAILAAVQAVAGLAAAGVGAVVGGVAGAIEGSELGALIRLVMLMMAKGATELAEVVALMGKSTKGNIVKLLRELKLDKLRAPLIDAVKAIVSKCAAALKWVGQKLTDLLEHILQSSGAGWVSRHWTTAKEAIDEGVRPLRELIAKMSDLEKRFYGFQADAIKALPDALAHIQGRLTQLLTQQVAKDTHVVAAGVKAEKPAAAVLLPQKVHPRVDQPLTRLEEQMPPKAKAKAKPPKSADAGAGTVEQPEAKAVGAKGDSAQPALAESKLAPVLEKPRVPEAPAESHANVKRKDGAAGDATATGEPTFASVYAKAPEAKVEIDAMADDIASRYQGARVAKAPVKSEARALQKLNDNPWIAGDPTLLNDLARNTIVVSPSQVDAVAAELAQRGANVRAIAPDSNPLGYSGVNSTLQTNAGILGEIQVNTPAMIYAKEPEALARQIIGDDVYDQISRQTSVPGGLGHQLYEQYRVLSPTDPEAAAIAQQSRDYYDIVRSENGD